MVRVIGACFVVGYWAGARDALQRVGTVKRIPADAQDGGIVEFPFVPVTWRCTVGTCRPSGQPSPAEPAVVRPVAQDHSAADEVM